MLDEARSHPPTIPTGYNEVCKNILVEPAPISCDEGYKKICSESSSTFNYGPAPKWTTLKKLEKDTSAAMNCGSIRVENTGRSRVRGINGRLDYQ